MLCSDVLNAVRNIWKYGILRYIGDLENGKMGLYEVSRWSYFYMRGMLLRINYVVRRIQKVRGVLRV